MEILVVGYNAFDVTVPVRGLPAPDSKQAVAEILHGGGGPGATAAVCLARLGACVRLVTVFGDDQGAAVQRRELAAAGVDCALSLTAAGHRSPQAVILVDPVAETRTIFWTRGTLPALSPAAVDPAWLDGCDLLYCDGHDPAAAARLAAAARARGLPVVLDGGSVRPGAGELVAVCSDVISSRGFAPELTGCAEPLAALRALHRRGPERVAMTFGAAGVLALDPHDDGAFHVPAFAVPVLDTTGAGDVLHAAYAFARARGDSWQDGLEFGAAAAALKCRDWGGRRGLPLLPEIEQLRRHGGRRSEVPPGWPPI
jgi:sulfofructose kinase